MMKSTNSESTQSIIIPKNLQRSPSPSGRFCSSTISPPISNLSTSPRLRSSSHNRNGRPRNIETIYPPVSYPTDNGNNAPATSSTKTEINSISSNAKKKKMCMCAPTTHPGSFRCRFHKNVSNSDKSNQSSSDYNTVSYYHRLYARRSAMTNSLVRIGTVEGDLMKRALASLIRPSSHQLKRREDFKPKPSRLSVMSKAEDELVLV